jgi:hypothetical protein
MLLRRRLMPLPGLHLLSGCSGCQLLFPRCEDTPSRVDILCKIKINESIKSLSHASNILFVIQINFFFNYYFEKGLYVRIKLNQIFQIISFY